MWRMVGERQSRTPAPRVATPTDALTVAGLLHDFNVEFHDPSPGPAVLAARLGRLLADDTRIVFLLESRRSGSHW